MHREDAATACTIFAMQQTESSIYSLIGWNSGGAWANSEGLVAGERWREGIGVSHAAGRGLGQAPLQKMKQLIEVNLQNSHVNYSTV